MKLAFNIAKRFLLYSKGQTALITLGIAIGVSVQIFIGLLISGLQADLINTTVGSSPHINIIANTEDNLFEYSSTIRNQLNSIDEIISIGVLADSPAFIFKEDKSASILVRGIAEQATDIYNLDNRLVYGRLASQRNEIVIGSLLANDFNLNLNETVTVQTVTNKTEEFKIVGVFDLKVAALNSTWIFTTLSTSQELFEMGSKVSGVEIQINDVFLADVIADELLLGDKVIIENWKEKNEQLLSGLNGQSVSSVMIQFFVLIAVVLGIASVLAITVLQKSRQIGILKAMGIQNSQASLIFLFQGLMLGVIGAVLGVFLGVGLIFVFTTFATNPDGSTLIPITFDPIFIGFSASVAIVSALLASLVPARKSSKLSPIEVIRNG
jgi:lipoprotein-releasing system permease protein